MAGTGFTADILGHAVFDAGGERIGRLVELYTDSQTGAVSFAGVAMIRRGRRRLVFVPLTGARTEAATVIVQCGKQLARRAPSVRRGQALPADAEPALFAHYGIRYASPDAQRRLTPCR